MQMRPNLNFAGYASDVLAHYHAAFGSDLEIIRFAGSPAAEHVPADWGERILYGRLRTPYGEIDGGATESTCTSPKYSPLLFKCCRGGLLPLARACSRCRTRKSDT